jgi:hypothetical protein
MVAIGVTIGDTLDDNELNKKLIDGLSKFCDIHKGEKALTICLTCKHSICSICDKDHAHHKVVSKSELMNHEYELNEMNNTLNLKLKELGIEETNGSLSQGFKPQELNKYCEDLISKVDMIKKRVTKIMNSYKMSFDSVFPMVLDFKDKINDLMLQLTHGNKESLLKNDKDFIDFYLKYEKMNFLNHKTNENIESIQKKLDKYRFIANEFKSRTESIIDFIDENYNKMKEYQLTHEGKDYVLTERAMNYDYEFINNNTISPEKTFSPPKSPSPGRKGRNISMMSGKINLFNLHNSPGKNERYELLKNFDATKAAVNERKATSKFINQNVTKIEPLSLDSNDNGKSETQTKIINIQISTKNIYIYDITDKKISVKELALPQPYKKFEAYHSILNYNNQFFISGSFSASKIIFEYDSENNVFNKLPDLPTGHSYHTLVGAKGYVFAISGFKTKKVEKFNLESKIWSNLPDVNYNRSWPSCLNNADKDLYICGGLNDPNTQGINIIERLNLGNPTSWEVIELNTTCDTIPFNFGIINISDDNIIFVGGNFIKNEESIDKCFILNLNDKTLNPADFKIPHNDNFDGKTFIQLDSETFGQFSTESYEKFYIYNKETKVFDIIEYK